MANALKLRAAIDVIRENQHRWDQSVFTSGPVNTETNDWHECGTTFCLAGWGAVLEGWRPAERNGMAVEGFVHPVTGEWRASFNLGGEIFELTEREAYYLFLTMTEDIEYLAACVERVIRGDVIEY